MTRAGKAVGLASLAVLLTACSAGPKPAERGAPVPSTRVIPADDGRFRYEGRFDVSAASAPVVIWQASRISVDFEGDKLAFLFDSARGRNFFNVLLDGETFIIGVKEGGRRVEFPAALARGRHSLTLFKRSEASAGTAAFLGIEIPAGKRAWRPKPPAYKLAMLFFGDSITAGACSEDGAADQWEDRSTHNNALSYAALTAAAFSADYLNIAVSGMGVSAGYTETKAGQAWDRLYPYAASPRAELKSWSPQVIFVNYGENDYSSTRGKGLPFPADFTDGYIALVRSIRDAWPSSRIVLLRGGMRGGAKGAELREAWEKAVARLEASDPGIGHFAFTHWSENHPRGADARALAEELAAWLNRQEFMRSH